LKTNTLKYIIFSGFFVLLLACSTKRNTFLSRNSHALSTKYNILYNGGIALDKGIEDVVKQNRDNFWERLPVERMQLKPEQIELGETKNPNFERAETKATKAIQKHSMNIEGSEKNFQMDEAYLMLGKARYYDQRFVPALEAFNYVLYKYPKSDKIYEVKIWREKTNMRLENDALAVNNLRKLLKEIKFKDQIFADANATLAQAFLNLEEKDSAVAKIKLATTFTKSQEEKARYRFILAQLYEEKGYKDSAYVAYQSVIDMKRKSARQYVIAAHARQASQFDSTKGDTVAFVKKFKELLEDRENRPFLDVLNHQMALFYDHNKNYPQAKKYYIKSIRKRSGDTYMLASNYRNMAEIYFKTAKYVTAGKYYDSTMVQLKPRTREFNLIKKKRDNLADVIKYEGIAQRNDSIISLYKMSDTEKTAYFDAYIVTLKKQEEAAKKLAAKAAIVKENQAKSSTDGSMGMKSDDDPTSTNDVAMAGSSNFYFYNSTTLAYGKKEFLKMWGKRSLEDNWRVSSVTENKVATNEDPNTADSDTTSDVANTKNSAEAVTDDTHSANFYIKQLPTSVKVIDSLAKDRNFAYYQLGLIYKEKFKENLLAVDKFERLLQNKPEERLVLPAMYNLYKLYMLTDTSKAEAMKAQILELYPNSRYAQILLNPSSEATESEDSPNAIYQQLYKDYQDGKYKEVLVSTQEAISRFNGEEIIPKLELLKATIVAKLSGLDEFERTLNYVSLNYPNSEEGKKAEKIISVDLPKLRALNLSKAESKNWKILYSSTNFEDKNTKVLIEKIKKFLTERDLKRLSLSLDIYTMTDNFVVIHGISSENLANEIVAILKEFKEYKVQEVPVVISAENYAVVQIKKNLADYISGKFDPNATQPEWDGSYDKPVDPKPAKKEEAPAAAENSLQDNDSPNDGGKPMMESKASPKAQQKGISLPPSPSMEKTDKKG
jgi:hypothetical protein